ncbi:hypothetical protein OEZ85_013827 [Tetradesmus obliquus]|uniref:UvrD-like helicase ATP-binding domain-containing protein n=1 Tax=Tetradesmus obliquus TaxID=3088 RepID=A0ABY8U6A2_TETOB|nr:hypothetical protein OEZ85_013827 [Tetradesmus obliquus]
MMFEAQQDAAASDFLQQQGWADGAADDAVPSRSGRDRYGLPARSRMTSEQRAVLDSILQPSRGPVGQLTSNKVAIVSACAGAGKTTLMKKLITQALSADSSSLILYTAYNAHVVRGPDGAGEWFGKKADLPDGLKKRVACRTAHSLAHEVMTMVQKRGCQIKDFSAKGYRPLWRALRDTRYFRARLRVNRNSGPSLQHAVDTADVLNIFMTSADSQVQPEHVRLARQKNDKFPRVGKSGDEAVPPYVEIAQQVWDMMMHVASGQRDTGDRQLAVRQNASGYTGDRQLAVRRNASGCKEEETLPVPHNAYFKMFVMEVVRTGRQLLHGMKLQPWSVIVVDEAQDYNDCMQQLIMSQRCTKIYVGDSYQHIYSFNNCNDALKQAAEAAAKAGMPLQQLRIMRSFRLAQPVTLVGNRLCFLMGERQAAFSPGSRAPCAVYGPPPSAAEGQQGPAAAAAAAATAIFKRMQLPGTATNEQSLPPRLDVIQLPSLPNLAAPGTAAAAQQQQRSNLAQLVVPPVDPATGHRPVVCVLVRYGQLLLQLGVSLQCLHDCEMADWPSA